ncbi:FT-interacting protein 7 [Eucalyptus grandis]|uniref:FT-interacting protein 7 n=1 Tax=Eucalyptus grandis TaxID=71139 RepID=UPI00192EB058|nr:FT-interacting protein 7 [Eucalyptus grandis]XP_010062432.2 FT-interacting protein 7 [Eucalyptus grandis]
MAKLVVEVLDASDLGPPKDKNGSASTYVEVEFDEQLQRTQTKPSDFNPQWNEKLLFNVTTPAQFPNATIEVVVYNDKTGGGGGGHHKHFLGRVRISGGSVAWSESQAMVQRYPLDKPGLFSHTRGDLALRIYAIQGFSEPFVANGAACEDAGSPLQEVNTNNLEGDQDSGDKQKKKKKKKKKKQEEKELRTFYSVGNAATATEGPANPPPMAPGYAFQAPPNVQMRADFAKASAPPANVMHMQVPRQKPEFGLVETPRPPVGAWTRFRGGDKMASTYDLVEEMHFLYVSVVKARGLPVMDVTGSLDPYVEVKLGNYKGVTRHLEKNQNPVWHQTFAFSRERMQSNFLEITVKDKDFGKDDFAGKVVFDTHEVPRRVPPDSPLAPQWYRLETRKGEKSHGEIMLAVWMGTQADESFPEAWHSDAHNVSHVNLSNTRSKVYFSPNLYYLRVNIIAAQDLIPSDRGRVPDTYVKVQLGSQLRSTRPSQMKTNNPVWDDELMFVVSEPFEDYIIISVEDRVGPGKDEILGRLMMPVRSVPHRVDAVKLQDTWFNLLAPSRADEGEKKKEVKFSSKICLRFCLELGYHVLDESTHFSSNLQPSSKHLRKPCVGYLELGIRSAKNLHPMKGRDGRTTDAYCVAKYGNKWARTRTLLDTLAPRWHERYTWEVYDPCTVITIGVFDNWHINGKDEARDQRIGKVRIRLSTLETDRIYIHRYPLLVLQPSGLQKRGELELALRFTCTAWFNMVTQYGKPLLPKMHYVQPIPVKHIDLLRHQAMRIVAMRLSRAEPPLRGEVIEYMLDVDYHMFSLRRSKANFCRIMSLLSGVTAICRWYSQICYWSNPITTCLVHVLFTILVCYPELILPTIFLYLFVLGIWNYRFRPRHPPCMDPRLSQAEFTSPDELDEEFDTFPSSKPTDIVRARYDRLRSVAGRVQSVVGDLATQGERAQALLSWRDPRATAIVIIFALILAVVLYVTPFQVVAMLAGLYSLRHPRFRTKMPSVPVNFFKRLPAKSDKLL